MLIVWFGVAGCEEHANKLDLAIYYETLRRGIDNDEAYILHCIRFVKKKLFLEQKQHEYLSRVTKNMALPVYIILLNILINNTKKKCNLFKESINFLILRRKHCVLF